jgi:hypothetical protein
MPEMRLPDWKIPRPFEFLKSLVSPGGPSTTKVVVLTTTMFLNLDILILVWFRVKWDRQVTAELTILTGLLATLVGYVHGRSKLTQERTTIPSTATQTEVKTDGTVNTTEVKNDPT